MRLFEVVSLVALGVIGTGCTHFGGPRTTSLPEPEVQAADETYVHAPSGMSFPVAVGEFHREKVKKYDTEGLNLSAGYNLFLPPRAVSATVFVYPSPPCVSVGGSDSSIRSMKETLSAREFDQCKAAILKAHPSATLVDQGDFTLTQQGIDRTGWRARFEYVDSFAHQRQPLVSELCLLCYVGDRWTVKYRFTRPAAGPGAEDVETFLRDYLWSIQTQ